MTPLRKRMLEDMQLRNLAPETQRNYLHHITGLARFYMTSPEHLTLEEIREYQLYLVNDRQHSAEATNQFVSAAKFLYNHTLETPWPDGALTRARVPHKAPVILSPEEITLLFDYVPTLRYRAALMTCYGAGLRVSEAVALKVSDLDGQRMLISVEQGKEERTATRCYLRACGKYWRSGARPPAPRNGCFPAFARAATCAPPRCSWLAGKRCSAPASPSALRSTRLLAGLGTPQLRHPSVGEWH